MIEIIVGRYFSHCLVGIYLSRWYKLFHVGVSSESKSFHLQPRIQKQHNKFIRLTNIFLLHKPFSKIRNKTKKIRRKTCIALQEKDIQGIIRFKTPKQNPNGTKIKNNQAIICLQKTRLFILKIKTKKNVHTFTGKGFDVKNTEKL